MYPLERKSSLALGTKLSCQEMTCSLMEVQFMIVGGEENVSYKTEDPSSMDSYYQYWLEHFT